MKTTDPGSMIRQLLSEESGGATASGMTSIQSHNTPLTAAVVKVCGITRVEDARAALAAGASLIGVIFAPSPRSATIEQARAIVQTVRAYGERSSAIHLVQTDKSEETLAGVSLTPSTDPSVWFADFATQLSKVTRRQPLVVGVFQNQSPEQV